MSDVSRRDLFRKTALVGAAAMAAGGVTRGHAGEVGNGADGAAAAQPAQPAQPQVDRRVLGRTGAEISLLGLGLGSAFTRPYTKDREAGQALLEQALDLGINYWDTCRGYKNSEEIIGPIVAKRRQEIFLVTKSGARDRDGYLRDVERSLKALQTDRVDLLHIWNIGKKDSVKAIAEGAAVAARELQAQGVTKHIGITGHSGAQILIDTTKAIDPDCVLSVFPCTRDDEGRYEDQLLPLARERNMGVIAMKTVRRARNADLKGTDLIRYALSLDGIHSAIVGLDTLAHLQDNAAMATQFEALTKNEQQVMHEDVSRALAMMNMPTPWEQPGYQDGALA